MENDKACTSGCLVEIIQQRAEPWPVDGQMILPFDDEDLVKIYGRGI